MKKLLTLISLISFLVPTVASAQFTVTQGGTGVKTSSPYTFIMGNDGIRLVASSSPTAGWFTATSTRASYLPYASTTAISVSGLTSGNCVQVGTGGLLTDTGSACGSGGTGFSTTSASYFSSLGLAFSTTSNDYWKSVNNFFSTTSADYWLTQQNISAFSTTSANYWASQGLAFSTTSANAWSAVGLGFSTTSAAYWKSQFGEWIVSNGNLVPTTTRGIFLTSSSTIQNLDTINGTTTNSTSTNLYVSGSASIPVLKNLTSNGFVKTSGANGTLSVDTNTYITGNQTITLSGVVSGSGATSITTTYSGVDPRGWNVLNGALTPTTTTYGILVNNASSTITNLDSVNSTSTNSTSTNNYVSGQLRVASLSGVLKATSGVVGTAANGTDYTLITATTCSGTDKVSAISASGAVTCSADQTGGGGSGGGTWSTTTSQVAGQLINYPNNGTDIVAIGANSTTTAEYWFDPNASKAYLSTGVGVGTTSPWTNLSIVGTTTASGTLMAYNSPIVAWDRTFVTQNPFINSAGFFCGMGFVPGVDSLLGGCDNDLTHWNTSNIGLSALNWGNDNISLGNYGAVFGDTNNSSSTAGITGGWQNQSGGKYNLVTGNRNKVYGVNAEANLVNGITNTLTNSVSYSLVSGNTNSINSSTDINVFGNSNTAEGSNSDTVLGGNNNFLRSGATDNIMFGDGNDSSADIMVLIGQNNVATINSGLSSIFGTALISDASGNITIGQGVNNSTKLTNNIANSLMIGNGSTIPTITLPFAGGSSLLSNVGIGSTSPSAQLTVHLIATDPVDTAFRIGSSTPTATTTLFQVSSQGIASTTGLIISNAGGSGTRCLQVGADGTVSANASACGTGGGSSFGQTWEIVGSTYLAPTSSWPILVNNATSTITNLVTVNSTSTSATTTTFAVANITASGSTTLQNFTGVNATTTNATTTSLKTNVLTVGSDVVNDITGSGLSVSGNALTLDRTGDWIGTFDGLEGSTYLANSFSTTSATYWKSQFGEWVVSNGNLVPTSTRGILLTASSTIQNLDSINSTSTNATSTNLKVSGQLNVGSLSGLLKATSGVVGTGSNGTDYTLISATTCGGTDKVSAISASGAVTCSADQTGGGSGTVSTSTTETKGQLPYWTSTAGTPATLGSVATTSLTASAPLSLSQPISVIGSSASVLSLSTAGDWTGTFDGIEGSSYLANSFSTSSATYWESQFGDWNVNSFGALVPTTTRGVFLTSSSTIQNLDTVNGTTTNATSTNLTVSGSASIPALKNLTSNGFVKTSGGNGTLSVDTSTYLTANQTITLSGVISGSGSTGITTSYSGVDPRGWNVVNGALTPTTTTYGILVNNASSTITNLVTVNSTSTSATTTALYVSGPTTLAGGATITCSGCITNTNLANSTISGISLGSNLANLSATDSTLTFSGTYNGGTARTIGINLGNTNTWSALQTLTGGILVNNSTSTITNLSVINGTTTNATSTALYVSGRAGVGTTTPWKTFSVTGEAAFDGGSAATSTIYVNSTDAAKGGRIILKDVNGSTCTEITTLSGSISSKAVTCP